MMAGRGPTWTSSSGWSLELSRWLQVPIAGPGRTVVSPTHAHLHLQLRLPGPCEDDFSDQLLLNTALLPIFLPGLKGSILIRLFLIFFGWLGGCDPLPVH